MNVYRVTLENGSTSYHHEESAYLPKLYAALSGYLVENVSHIPGASAKAYGNLDIETEIGAWENGQFEKTDGKVDFPTLYKIAQEKIQQQFREEEDEDELPF